MADYDLIIVGAGPAGLCLASELADSNLKILLLDKKKNAEDVQYNTSGSFIDPEEWQLPSDILNPIDKMYFTSRNEQAIKKVRGYTINRKKLLTFFENKARQNKNFEIKYNSLVQKFDSNKLFYSGGEATAKIYVDCSGISAIIGSKLGVVPRKPVIAVGMEYQVPYQGEKNEADLLVSSQLKGGYGWVFSNDDQTAIVGYGTFLPEHFVKVEKYLKSLWQIERVAKRCELRPLEKKTAVLRTGSPIKNFIYQNLMVLGDSSLQANPIVGEGVRFVMDSARMAAGYIRQTIKNNNLDLLNGYNNQWRKKYYRQYKLAFKIQQKLKTITADDKKLDFGTRTVSKMSDKSFERLLKGELNYPFLAKIALRSLI